MTKTITCVFILALALVAQASNFIDAEEATQHLRSKRALNGVADRIRCRQFLGSPNCWAELSESIRETKLFDKKTVVRPLRRCVNACRAKEVGNTVFVFNKNYEEKREKRAEINGYIPEIEKKQTACPQCCKLIPTEYRKKKRINAACPVY